MKIYYYNMNNYIEGRVKARNKLEVKQFLKHHYGRKLYNLFKKNTLIYIYK